MSRSRKKRSVYKDKTKGMKQIANRKVRNSENIPNGSAYKKYFDSYDISDYWFSCTFDEFKESYMSWNSDVKEEELYRKWYKYYKMK